MIERPEEQEAWRIITPDETQIQNESDEQATNEGADTGMSYEEVFDKQAKEDDKAQEEQIALPIQKEGIRSSVRTPEEVEDLRRKYLDELKWEGTMNQE